MAHLTVNGVALYSEVDGAGDPVLVLHGGFLSLEHLRPLVEDLVGRHRVLAYERPGHGRSADVDGEYDYDRGVADALAYLDAHGLGTVDVVGYSDGAVIALLLALQSPDRVRSLVVISANLDPSVYEPRADGPPVLDPLPVTRAPGVDPLEVERGHYVRLSPDGPGHADVVLAKLFRLWTQHPHIDPADLAAVSARTLVMSADHDTIPPAHSLLIAASIPGAQLCIVPGTSHDLISQRPELVSSLVREFLAD